MGDGFRKQKQNQVKEMKDLFARDDGSERWGLSPYLAAHAAYHRDGPPLISWTDALDFHLQYGVVICTPRCFLMARSVQLDWPDAEHVSFRRMEGGGGDCVHVWAAGGSLGVLLPYALGLRETHLSFQRRTGRVHRWRIGRMEQGVREWG